MISLRSLLASLCLVGLLACASPALAQDLYTTHAEAARQRARDAYNAEDFKKAAGDFVLAAQIDPGAAWLKGTPYRDLARTLFWLGNPDKAVFWYDVYLKNWPKAADRKAIKQERDGANRKRTNPDRRVKLEAIYDRSLLELVDTLRARIERGDTALTPEGGGTTRLYFQAVQQGYAMPELDLFAKSMRAQLLTEIEGRWKQPADAPMPRIGSDAEAPEVTRKRLASLRSLAPTRQELDKINAWQRLLDAWEDFEGERYDQAASAMLDAAGTLPDQPWIVYTAALCLLRAGRASESMSILGSAAPGAPEKIRPYYFLLRAEAYRLEDQQSRAAGDLWKVLTEK